MVTAAAWVLASAYAGGAQQARAPDWPDQGCPALIEAAARARGAGRRLLIGLSGGDT